jgi:hypothetical protein
MSGRRGHWLIELQRSNLVGSVFGGENERGLRAYLVRAKQVWWEAPTVVFATLGVKPCVAEV